MQISIEFLKIVATEVVVYFVKHPIKYILFWLFSECKSLCSNKIENKKMIKKAQLDISEFVVWSLYFQTVLWMTPMFCPMFILIAPILLYVLFYYTSFTVRVFYHAHTGSGA